MCALCFTSSVTLSCLRWLKRILEELSNEGAGIQRDSIKQELDELEMVLMNMQCDSVRNKMIVKLRLACITIMDDNN